MTKSELIEKLAERMSLPKQGAEAIVNAIFDSIKAALKRGERIEIRGLGTFEVRSYEAYEGRNPKTGVRVAVQPKRVPFFKAGKEMRERLNEARESAEGEIRSSPVEPGKRVSPLSNETPA